MAHASLVALTGSDQVVIASTCVFRGFTLRETAGSTAVVRIYDHASAASGTLIESVSLAANESTSDLHDGVLCRNGVYVDVVSGAVEGSVRL